MFDFNDDCLNSIALFADGDTRTALNSVERIVTCLQAMTESELFSLQSTTSTMTDESMKEMVPKENQLDEIELHSEKKEIRKKRITLGYEAIKQFIQKDNFAYDKSGEDHHNAISALHKSMRGSDEDAALYWLERMIISGENPKYVARRMIRFACEDVGLADVNAMTVAMNTFQAIEFLGYPECKPCLVECCLYLTRTKKSIGVYSSMLNMTEIVKKNNKCQVPVHVMSVSEHSLDTISSTGSQQIPTSPQMNSTSRSFLPDKLSSLSTIDYDRFLQPIDKNDISPIQPFL